MRCCNLRSLYYQLCNCDRALHPTKWRIALGVASFGNLFSFSREIDSRLAIENLSIAIAEDGVLL